MKRLLLIDNSSVIINVLKDLFTKDNDFKISIARSFKEAEELLLTYDFFCINFKYCFT